MDDRPTTLQRAERKPIRRAVLDLSSPKDRSPAGEGGAAALDGAKDAQTRARAPTPDGAPPSSSSPPRLPQGRAAPWRSLVLRSSGRALKLAATVLIFAAAVLAALLIWDYYVTSPWTRDGRVRVQVANVAPQVSGQITEIHIVDNQFVHKGDVLYVIDPFDFRVSLRTARATVQQRAADMQVKRVQAERRQHLTDLATTPEEQQQYVGNATQAQAAFEAAQAEEAQADINLKRTQVTAPVNGFVTNLQMRVGNYAHEGTSNLSVVDADSFWVDGYFEETKMTRVCVGDVAEAQLMGYAQPLLGHVVSVTRGISVSDAASSTQGLPNVDAIYTWVRLAQRVPVRMTIEHVPLGVPLVSGMTATVSVRNASAPPSSSRWRTGLADLGAAVRRLVDRPEPRADCVPAIGDLEGRTVTLPSPEPAPSRRAEQINPGLAPGMAVSPRPR